MWAVLSHPKTTTRRYIAFGLLSENVRYVLQESAGAGGSLKTGNKAAIKSGHETYALVGVLGSCKRKYVPISVHWALQNEGHENITCSSLVRARYLQDCPSG